MVFGLYVTKGSAWCAEAPGTHAAAELMDERDDEFKAGAMMGSKEPGPLDVRSSIIIMSDSHSESRELQSMESDMGNMGTSVDSEVPLWCSGFVALGFAGRCRSRVPISLSPSLFSSPSASSSSSPSPASVPLDSSESPSPVIAVDDRLEVNPFAELRF